MTPHEHDDGILDQPSQPRVTAPDAAAAWSTAANAWSAELGRIMKLKGMGSLTAVGVSPHITKHWLTGKDAPRTQEEHDAALAALDLLETTRPRALEARKTLQTLFKQLENTVAGAPERAASHVEKLAYKPYSSRRVSGQHGQHRPNPINDHPAIAKRIHNDESIAYNELDKVQLLDILSTTENPHEYLTAARALAGTSATDRDHKLDAAGAQWEHGSSLPSRETLETLEQHFGETESYVGDFDRFKHLVINARLDRLQAESAAQGESEPVGKALMEMPKEYWRAVIDDHLHGDSFKHQQSENAILWQHKLVPIAHKGDYVRAMRELLQKAPQAIVSFDGNHPEHRHAGCINQFENQHYPVAGVPSDGVVADIMQYFDNAQKNQPGEPAFFDRDRFLSLPYTTKQQSHSQRYAAGNSDGTHRSR